MRGQADTSRVRFSPVKLRSVVAVVIAASSIAVSLLFLVLLARLIYLAGEWLRHCAYDCGDMGGRGLAFGFGLVSLLLPLAGFLWWAGRNVIPEGRWPRAYWSAVEAAVGAVGVLWLITSFLAPIVAVVAFPIGLASLAIAGATRRALRVEIPLRDVLDAEQLADVGAMSPMSYQQSPSPSCCGSESGSSATGVPATATTSHSGRHANKMAQPSRQPPRSRCSRSSRRCASTSPTASAITGPVQDGSSPRPPGSCSSEPRSHPT